MKKVSEEWTPDSITSVFRLSSGFHQQCPFTSEVCGLGWRFEVVSQLENFEIRIQPSIREQALHKSLVQIQLTSEGSDPSHHQRAAPLTGPPHTSLQKILRNTELLYFRHGEVPPSNTFRANIRPCCLQNVRKMTFKVTFETLPMRSKGPLLLLSAAFAATTTTVTPMAMRSLETSISSGTSFDVQFIAFSYRSSSASLAHPLTIHANSTVMQDVLAGFFLDDNGGDRSLLLAIDVGETFEYEEDCFAGADDYDYESDSDFDGDEVLTESEEEDTTTEDSQKNTEEDTFSEPDPVKDLSESMNMIEEIRCHPSLDRSGDVLSDGGSGVLLTSVCSGGGQSPVLSSIKSGSMASAQDRTSTDFEKTSFAKPAHIGRMMLVKGAAYKTWHAFIYYCYTDQINFSPLKSQKSLPQKPPAAHVDHNPPTCSPKSMYRLADKIGNTRLKQIAFEAIRASLSTENILKEALSKFTSRYPEIQEMEISILVAKRAELELDQLLPRAFQEMALGKTHSQPVLTKFVARVLQM
ncbi:hypothetical protein BJ138DRAFT_301542 [Hygrophoropsis aurantiaca]|uniref:Uncharacterized protein n=1 Tax=Hygrophoropsis aurantiaca TaxID=72124 RepID=A0ACB8A653_9AGAM|nr:hypothetical protein BJ138DRAFT_301542 [Hygrophoropsis aurantiaca]